MLAESASKKSSYNVSAVESALELLMLVAENPGQGLSDLARLSGYSKPRTFRLLQTMETSGFVVRTGNDAQYHLGKRAHQLGEQAKNQIDLAAIFAPIVQEYVAKTNETVQIRTRVGLESVCQHFAEPDRIVRFHCVLGSRNPLHVGSSKILLAFAPDRVRRNVFSAPLKKFTDATKISPADLTAQLQQIVDTGYCISRGETDPDAVSVGAPVRDSHDEVVAAFIIAAPASRVSDTRMQELAALAIEAARKCEGALQNAMLAG